MLSRIGKIYAGGTILFFGFVACNDNPKPTELPVVAAKASIAAPNTTGKSTVCAMYQTRLATARNIAADARSGGSSAGLATAESDEQNLEAVVNDVCN